jgi:hypothetical protein
MAILRIYGDEAGTMPQSDNGDIFVAATVSVFGAPPIITEPDGHIPWFLNKLKDFKALPYVSYIKPVTGYGNDIKRKIEKMNVMARMTRLITGANRSYLTQEGVPLRNYVWLYCMKIAIGQALVGSIFRGEVEKIEVVLDQKTMATPTRTLFKNQVQITDHQLAGVLDQAKLIYPHQKISSIEARLRTVHNSISLLWSDEDTTSISKGGLHLAHYLASHFRKGLLGSDIPTIQKLLIDEGFNNIDLNITDQITSIDQRAINNWEKNTGLKEPSIS